MLHNISFIFHKRAFILLDVQFSLRNRMTERISHLTGLWIGAVISNTSH
jgi:hypothetical protein